jgi:excisionase family DNA binding protein
VLTVAELAAYLGLSPSRIRHIVADHGIRSPGRKGKAKVYRPGDVLRHTGRHDRLAKTAPSAAH